MSERYARLGVPSGYYGHASHFERVCVGSLQSKEKQS